MLDIFQKNLDVIFFIYGLSFVFMGIVVIAQSRKESGFGFESILWLLACFGLIHGANELLDMWVIIKGSNKFFNSCRIAVLVVSYIFLMEFGARLLRMSSPERKAKAGTAAKNNIIRPLILLAFSITAFVISYFGFYEIASVCARYFLGFPASILTGFGMLFYYKGNKDKLMPLGIEKYFFFIAGSFFIYSFLGAVVPKGNFFPANWLNIESFMAVVKIPVQFFRAAMAICIALGVAGICRVFAWEHEKWANQELGYTHEKLKAAQFQLIQSTKMASLGQLATGLIHEISNPLTTILNNIEFIKIKSGQKNNFSSAEIKELIGPIEGSAVKCRSIIKSLLNFAHASTFSFQPISLDKEMEKVIGLVEQELSVENITIQKNFTAHCPPINGDPQLLQEVFLNIIVNGRWAIQKKAGKKGGVISIKIEHDAVKNMVDIFMTDDGIGMPENVVNKIFDPFFTTKKVGEGTGLGLSVAYGIIKEHKGAIEAASELNKGAAFKISLPAMS